LPFVDLLNGRIVHVSFDCPENLREAFNSATKANGTSTCFVLRGFMQTYVVTAHYQEACFSNTKKPIVIEKLVMPTFVKTRVRRIKTKEVFEEENETIAFCGVGNCKKTAVARGIWLQTKLEYNLCSLHLAGALSNPKSWQVLT
jgi:hypothetical protein